MAQTHDPKDPWSSEKYSQKVAPFMPFFAAKVIALLDPQPTDQILDLGCGDGVITSQISSSCAHIHGIDSSPNMISAALTHYSTPKTTYTHLDATRLPSPALPTSSFSKIFSHSSLHWILRSPPLRLPTLKSLHALLRPSGTFAAEFGAHGNCAEIHAVLISALIHRGVAPAAARDASPWYFPTEAEVRDLWSAAGFVVESLEIGLRQTELTGGDVGGWVELFGSRFLDMVPAGEREGVVEEVRQVLEGVCRMGDGGFRVNYVRCRVLARRGDGT